MSQNHFFSLPFTGIKNGKHHYEFEVKSDFFDFMESSLLKEGEFKINVELDRRSSICDLSIDINGKIPAVCDRCVATIELPVSAQYDLVVKVTTKEEEDTEDILFIKDTEPSLVLDQIIYELICVSLPLVNIYNCEEEDPIPCNELVLNKLKSQGNDKSNPIWDDIKIDNNN